MAEAKAYDWTQSDSEVTIKFPCVGIGTDKLKVKIESTKLSVTIAGTTALASELSGKVDVDESYWQVEGSDDSRALVVALCKKKTSKWAVLTKAEEDSVPKAGVMDDNFDVIQLEHDDDDPERVEEQEENERKLEARYIKQKDERGLDDEETLKTFFALFDNCIQLYRLNKLSDYLAEVVPVCRKRDDKYKLKAVQALAFVRWKQSKFREALPLFHEMEEILGKGAALCENIAHTYNSLGDYEKAEDYFRQSLKFIEQEHGMNRGNRGGVLLGLGLVRDRLGKHKEALPVCLKAYEFYKDRANGAPASLQAKAAISCAKLNAKLGNLPKAEEFIREAVQMYEVTCGATSPLTASAYHELGKCLWAQKKRHPAQDALKRAYELESMKDAWELVPILEIHNLLMDTHLKETDQIERDRFKDYFKVVDYVCGRVNNLPQDGNAAVYYKAAAELKAWGGEYVKAKSLFDVAIPLFLAETSTDCAGLIQSCNDMIAFCDRNLAGTQNSPMNFDIGAEATQKKMSAPMNIDLGDGEGRGSTHGVKIEEILDDVDGNGDDADAATDSFENIIQSARELRPCQYREAIASDFPDFAKLCVKQGSSPLLQDEEQLRSHLSGHGHGLCWAAERGGDLVGFALCGSDGIFGHVIQLLIGDDSIAEEVRLTVLEKVAAACRSRGLRRLAAATMAGTTEDTALSGLGGDWARDQLVLYSLPLSSASSAAPSSKPSSEDVASRAASSSSTAKPNSELARDGKEFSEFYGAWDKVNVEKALAAEDGLDPSMVPEAKVNREDFDVGYLEVGRKLPFSWDQSDKTVSLYFTIDGVGSIPPDDIEVLYKTRGVLLMVKMGEVKKWWKCINLCKDIDIDACTKKVKPDSVVVKLKKVEAGHTWSDITDEKDEYQKKRSYRVEHGDLKGASTEELLADMYKNATDEERSGLRDAMRVNREKRAEEGKDRV